MPTLIVVRDIVGPVPYWSSGSTLPEARKNFKKFSGKFPSAKASIVAFKGDGEDLDNIQVTDLGDIVFNRRLVKTVIQ